MQMFYKIRNSEGYYSSGGFDPKWRKGERNGKVWKSLQYLKSHLRQDKLLYHIYKDCQIVEYIVSEAKTLNMKSIFEEIDETARKNVIAYEKLRKERELNNAKRQIKEIANKYPELIDIDIF